MAKETNNRNNASDKMRKPKFNLSWLYLFLLAGVAYVFLTKSNNPPSKQLAYTDFQACLDSGYVKEIMVNKDYL